MGRPFGEVRLAKHLEELDVTLQNYYGGINQLRMNITPDNMPEKPMVVIMLDQMEQYDALPEEGGLLDQPHLLMREIEKARQIKTMFENSYRNYLKSLKGNTQ